MTERRYCYYFLIPTFFILTLFLSPATAGEPSEAAGPGISIIIDDIGYRWIDDRKALELPGPLAYAIMPHSPHAGLMSRLASEDNKDVILHLPMEALDKQKNRYLGPGALMLDMDRSQFIKTLYENLHSVPNIIGVNNHMGSLLTRHAGHMGWLMQHLRAQGIFYIDSVTIHKSVTRTVARKNRVPYQQRDVFLDHRREEEHIHAQFDKLLRISREKGHAIAIGHPHPETIAVLAERLAQLEQEGVALVSLKSIIPEPDMGPPLQLTRHP